MTANSEQESKVATGQKITTRDIAWETLEGRTYGYFEIGGDDYEIEISERVTYRAGWRAESNLRTWTITNMYESIDGEIARGDDADGLRVAKRDAIAALNIYVSRHRVS